MNGLMMGAKYAYCVTTLPDPVVAALNSDYEFWLASGKGGKHPKWTNFEPALQDLIGCDVSRIKIRLVNDNNVGVRLNETNTGQYYVLVCPPSNTFTSASFLTEPQKHVGEGNSEGVLLFRQDGETESSGFSPWRIIALEHSPIRDQVLSHWPAIEDYPIPNPASMRNAILQIAQLQAKYVPNPRDGAMIDRKSCLLELALFIAGQLNNNPSTFVHTVDAHFGQGNPVKTPYIRIYDPLVSPNAQTGYYVCLFISADGSSVLISIQSGANIWDDGRYKPLPNRELAQRSDRLYDGLIEHVDYGPIISARNAKRTLDIEGVGGEIGPKIEKYKHSNVAAVEVSIKMVPSDSELKEILVDFTNMAKGLNSGDQEIIKSNIDGIELIAQNIYWPNIRIAEVLDSLQDKSPQVVLAGPPGTGKTYVARWFAAELLGLSGDVDNDRITLVQFHPTYGYEDFVEGLRPVSEHGVVVFKTVPGAIVKLSRAIQEDDLPRVLIIDEINRANIARVFGELMYLLEYRDRKIDLMLHEGFSLPSNLYIIATMNTADKSTRVMDAALRRRFDFFTLNPDVEVLKAHYSVGGAINELGDKLFEGFDALNLALANDLDKHRLIGHSYFMEETFDVGTLRAKWERQIAPLIDEYFFERHATENKYTLERFWPSAST